MRLRHQILAVAVALAAVALAAGCGSASPSSSTPGRPSPAAHRQLWQPRTPVIGVTTADAPRSYSGTEAFDNATGVKANLVMYYSGWQEDFKTAFARQADKNGATVLVNIDTQGGAQLGAIAAGRYDTYLKRFASEINAFGHPVVVSFDHEMNGTWYPYGYTHVASAEFVAAWRHVHRVIDETTALVTWMWTINIYAGNRTGPLAPLYPGDAYVDVIGIDGYDYSGTQPPAKTFGTTIHDAHELAPSKPMMIAETSVAPGPNAATQTTELFQVVKAGRLLGVLWFDVDRTHYTQGTDRHDWRLEDDPAALAAFRAAVREYR
ncbi:MAG: hypothetical protein J2P25_02015 [Nocardiopsaceae bacterium]|nr:hypothetical protein [Nocardiopsaceae bacterium]